MRVADAAEVEEAARARRVAPLQRAPEADRRALAGDEADALVVDGLGDPLELVVLDDVVGDPALGAALEERAERGQPRGWT
ncbi:hypothetical protein OV079_04545 [Nannocystis pusilla]|uniref:Uncharacterized protein n=1 Tax=Nannocystis pusilla TaxID=889268 RepID=A0A9X3EIT8_9BACT|nr:hypothetical protein [Nannocystis pusilla]MCY1004852.1 hypothetical protein [Nannocystis pusilla]